MQMERREKEKAGAWIERRWWRGGKEGVKARGFIVAR